LSRLFVVVFLHLDVRFNKGLIENCQVDIDKHCKTEIVDTDGDGKDSDDDQENNKGK